MVPIVHLEIRTCILPQQVVNVQRWAEQSEPDRGAQEEFKRVPGVFGSGVYLFRIVREHTVLLVMRDEVVFFLVFGDQPAFYIRISLWKFSNREATHENIDVS